MTLRIMRLLLAPGQGFLGSHRLRPASPLPSSVKLLLATVAYKRPSCDWLLWDTRCGVQQGLGAIASRHFRGWTGEPRDPA